MEKLSDLFKVTRLGRGRGVLNKDIDSAVPSYPALQESLGKQVARALWPGICSKAVDLESTKDLNNEFQSLAPS